METKPTTTVETRTRRWLYQGRRPNWIARFLNGAWAAVISMGITSRDYVTLEVAGRKSGRIVSFPLVMVIVAGKRYLVSMLGEYASWVLNVRAAGGRAVIHRGSREAILLEAVPASECAPILKAYLQVAPGARPHIPVDKNAPLGEFEKIAHEFPVFRVVSSGAQAQGR